MSRRDCRFDLPGPRIPIEAPRAPSVVGDVIASFVLGCIVAAPCLVILASVALIVSAGRAARKTESDEEERSDALEHRRAQLEPEIGFEG